MKAIKAKIIIGVVSSLIVGSVSHVGYTLLVTVPRVEAKVNKLDGIEPKIDKLMEDTNKIKGKLGVD